MNEHDTVRFEMTKRAFRKSLPVPKPGGLQVVLQSVISMLPGDDDPADAERKKGEIGSLKRALPAFFNAKAMTFNFQTVRRPSFQIPVAPAPEAFKLLLHKTCVLFREEGIRSCIQGSSLVSCLMNSRCHFPWADTCYFDVGPEGTALPHASSTLEALGLRVSSFEADDGSDRMCFTDVEDDPGAFRVIARIQCDERSSPWVVTENKNCIPIDDGTIVCVPAPELEVSALSSWFGGPEKMASCVEASIKPPTSEWISTSDGMVRGSMVTKATKGDVKSIVQFAFIVIVIVIVFGIAGRMATNAISEHTSSKHVEQEDSLFD